MLGLSVGRAAVGAAMLARPELVARSAGLDRGTSGRASWVMRMVGVRDLALGVSTARAAVTQRPLRGWLLAGAVVDLADTASIGAEIRTGRLPKLRGAIAAGVCASALVTNLAAVRDADGAHKP